MIPLEDFTNEDADGDDDGDGDGDGGDDDRDGNGDHCSSNVNLGAPWKFPGDLK